MVGAWVPVQCRVHMAALGVPELGGITKGPQKPGPSVSPGYLQAIGV